MNRNHPTLFFIGIGGIGMSALARYFNKRGYRVYGYDRAKTQLTMDLEEEGIHIHYEDRVELIPKDIEFVIITPAIPADLKEYQHVLKLKIPIYKRSEILGKITFDKNTIAVAGTHGKTTTSSLLAHLLYDSGVEMSAFLGGVSVNYNSNYLDQGDQWIVAEADEYDRSFLQLFPKIAIIGSLDADHLDIYGTRERMIENYLTFAAQIQKNGILLMSDTIAEEESTQFKSLVGHNNFHKYGLNNDDIKVNISRTDKGWTTFNYCSNKTKMEDLVIRLPGQHNIRNTAAAITVALELGVEEHQIRKALLNFQGIKRRFEWIFETNLKVLIDDYAHHPEELRSAISACRDAYPGKKITGIFQPHLYSRTRDFMDEFASVLSGLDQIILLEIYPARELEIPGINSSVLFNKINHAHKWLTSKESLSSLLQTLDHEVVLCLGAGDLDQIMDKIKEAVFQTEALSEIE